MGHRVTVAKPKRHVAQHHKYALNNRAWQVLKSKHKAYSKIHNLPCWLAAYGMCLLDGVPIDYNAPSGTRAAYETDHKIPRSVDKQKMYVWNNLRASHCTCNRSRQAKPVVEQHVWIRPSF